jgi:Vam6/Vps39-like protein vacuolar protein sorting-associated protein 39
MSKHFSRLDAARALDELPPETPLQALHKFFESAVWQQSEHRNNLDITKALLRADHLKVSDEYQQRRSRRVVVTAGKRCKVSGAKIGTSAFAVYPNNMCVLLSENADVHVCPVTGRNFKEHPVD